MDAAKLAEVLEAHGKWLRCKGGVRADLRGADLRGADLRGAGLRGAGLRGAVLRGADLGGADLSDADLTGANLRGANLTDVNLTRADLTGASLRGANLRGANLTDVNLTDVILTRVDLRDVDLTGAPVVPRLDARILEAIKAGGSLDMSDWHTCETTHCRAGWAVVLAGPEGKALEEKFGPSAAGALIYAASRPGKRVPEFYASREDAMASIEADAKENT